jgi:UDP-glucose 4-epimerase
MRVLVTGGAGFIGSHVVERLLSRGASVVVVDDLSTGDTDNLAHLSGCGIGRLTVHRADVRRIPSRALAGVTHGVHLAARTDVATSMEDPVGYFESNVLGSVHVLQELRRAGAQGAVVASSAAVYGDIPPPVGEDALARPISPYGAGKLAVDLYAAYCTREAGFPVASLRFFNVYGPRQHPRSPYSGVISVFTRAAIAGDDMVVHGDGRQTRDFVYVADVAEAVERALLRPEAAGVPINIATGRGTSVNLLARRLAAMGGGGSRVRHGPTRAGDIRRSVARVDRARELLGFEATTGLSGGLRRTVEWMRVGMGAVDAPARRAGKGGKGTQGRESRQDRKDRGGRAGR